MARGNSLPEVPPTQSTPLKRRGVSLFRNWTLLAALVGLTVLVGLLAGSYPALYLSRFQPVHVLKDRWRLGGRGPAVRVRAALVVLQFAISIVLVVVTLVMDGQLRFIQNKRLGFDKENVIIIPVKDDDVQRNFEGLKTRFLSSPGVLAVTALSNYPWRHGFYDFPVKAEGMPDATEINFPTLLVDHDFVRTFGLEITQGRDFSKAFTTDASEGFILNETAVKELGWRSPIGKKLEIRYIASGGPRKGQVIGVVRDFHFRSLHHKIEPLVILASPALYYLDNFAVRISSARIPETLSFLKSVWQEQVPARPFDFFFLKQDFDQLYQEE
ncbi:hypothetical protein D6833_04370 [Candidatus Parcubacteria bacterium]|nr:MAG: hypothetical protein D6833_04370 [Candidatus Parcubacteria bacterium]